MAVVSLNNRKRNTIRNAIASLSLPVPLRIGTNKSVTSSYPQGVQMVLKTLLPALVLLPTLALAGEPAHLDSFPEKLSYSIGAEMGRNLKKQGTPVDVDLIVRGLKEGLAGEKLLLSEKELRKVMNSYQADVRKKQAQTTRRSAEENKIAGETFLAENRKKAGVITLPSGVQYKIITAGNGAKPTNSDTVICNYRGTLIDGTEFDSTLPGTPSTLKLSQLIPGWKEALKLMPAGSTWQIVVPSQLAYGTRGVGRDIGPNETLIFTVELLAVK